MEHFGRFGGDKDSKTECIYFPAFKICMMRPILTNLLHYKMALSNLPNNSGISDLLSHTISLTLQTLMQDWLKQPRLWELYKNISTVKKSALTS
jgi:hypothetical protein